MDDPTAIEARTLLARAYLDDPMLAWLFPDERHRLEASAAWLGLGAERYLAGGQVDSRRRTSLAALALWRLPGMSLGGAATLPTTGGLLEAVVGTDWAAEIARGFAAARAAAAEPAEPHAYLHFLAVAPEHQGEGLGGELLDEGLARARAIGLPVRLETTNPANLGFYRSHGLRVLSEVRLGEHGPTMWALETARP